MLERKKKVLAEVVVQDLGAMRGVWAMIARKVDVRGRAELLRGMATSRLSRLEVDYPSAGGTKVRWSCE